MMIAHVTTCTDQLCFKVSNLPPCNVDSNNIKLHISTIDCGNTSECSSNPVERREDEYCWSKKKTCDQTESFTIEHEMICFKDGLLCFELDNLFLDKTPQRYNGTIIVDDVCVGEFQIQLEVAKIRMKHSNKKDCVLCNQISTGVMNE